MEGIIDWLLINESRSFYLILIISFLINRLPVVGAFFRSVNTLLHECGHAIMAIITSGEVMRIDLNKDTSGVAQTKSSGKFSAFLTSFAGYPFAALAGSIFLVMAINGYHKAVAFILLSLVLLNLMLFVRNLYGIIWLIVFATITFLLIQYGNDAMQKLFILFVSMITVTESFTSTLLITFLAFVKPRSAGDMANMQKTSGIPAGFWAMNNCAIVLIIVYYTIVHYFPGIRQIVI